MAKLERKMYAQFVSLSDATAAAVEKSFSGAEISNVAVVAATFGVAVENHGGTYIFTYDESNWERAGATVTLATYGITVTGTPATGDTITVTFTPANSGWVVLGADNDDLKKEMNPDTETKKNVLGENAFVHNGYESKVTVEPYYANPSDAFYEKLLDIVMLESNAEAKCLGKYAEVVFTAFDETTKIATGTAYVQDAWIIPQSIGGDTSGVQIPFEVNPVGPKTKKNVSYNAATHTPTFTPIGG